MQLHGETFIQKFESYCPQWLAEKGDPVGLHIGTLDKTIQTIMVTLDVRPEVVAEAIEKKVDLLIAKHPPIFRPLDRLCTDDVQTNMYAQLLAHNISVYAAHTNLDIIEDGLNDWLCESLQIEHPTFLAHTHTIQYKKLAVYVPTDHAESMRKILAEAGAGIQGNYQHTSYSHQGIGRFKPSAATDLPTEQEETVPEVKIEVMLLETQQKRVIQAMKNAHPYEEPVYELYSVENIEKQYGIGRIGNLHAAITLEQLIEQLRHVFDLDGLRIVNPKNNQFVQRIAICGGSGGKFFPQAVQQKADVYITGDVYYHTAHDMQAADLTVIDPGHYIEALCKTKLVERFNQWKQENQWEVTILPSQVNTNPFQFR